jgi:predicted Zn-dependent protease
MKKILGARRKAQGARSGGILDPATRDHPASDPWVSLVHRFGRRWLSISVGRLLILSVLAFGCFSGGPGLPRDAGAFSLEDERKLGEEMLAQIRQHFAFVEDEFATNYINDLGQFLLIPVETKPFPFHFYLLKDNSLNAFAAPGGNIFVFTGLIEVTADVDELANVICHEIGHVTARHLAQRIDQSKKIGMATMAGMLAGVLLGGGPLGGAMMMGSAAAGIQAQLHYSRNDERQADQLGFKYIESTGFDPKGMIAVLNKIEQGQYLGSNKVPAYLLTHPTGPERMSNLDAILGEMHPSSGTEEASRARKLYPYFKAVIRARSQEPHEAEQRFKSELQDSPDSPAPNLGLGIVYMEKSELDLSLKYLGKALEKGAPPALALRYMAEAYQLKGLDKEAVSALEKALSRDPQDGAVMFLLAVSYENLQRHEQSIQLLEQLASRREVRDDVFYHLGLSYGRLNRLALAHYNFGIYFRKMGERQKAAFHFKKADELAAGDPDLQRRIQEAQKGMKEGADRQPAGSP